MTRDRGTMPLVCRSWRTISSHIFIEYLRIRSVSQLRAVVHKLERSKGGGEGVQRIDFQISEPLTECPDLIPRLLSCTPNLMIYVNQHGSDYRPERQTPTSVLDALATFCGPSLRRLEWSHVGEAPTWHDLANLCLRAPNLRTLRLTWLFSYEPPYPAKLHLPLLETLSLGIIPDPIDSIVEDIPLSWDPLLDHLSDPETLPALRRLEVDIFPKSLRFFKVHGRKIRTFRTTSWSKVPMLPRVLPLLPHLDTLVLTQSLEYITLPPAHTTLRRICIAPFAEDYMETPPRHYADVVIRPLESLLLSIDSTHLPHLEEIRLRTVGILEHVAEDPAWLRKWAKRWRFKGVRFCDMHASAFAEYPDADHDPRLDAVRG